MSASSELIRVEDLHKSFGSLQVLKGVSETISKGEVVSIIGPSGGVKEHLSAVPEPVGNAHLRPYLF